MREHLQLLSPDDTPVALCIVRNGTFIDWSDNSPEEVLYISEEIFEECAPSFLRNIVGERYYGTTGLTAMLFAALEADLRGVLESPYHSSAHPSAAAMLSFLSKAKMMSDSHYVAFEGP